MPSCSALITLKVQRKCTTGGIGEGMYIRGKQMQENHDFTVIMLNKRPNFNANPYAFCQRSPGQD